MSISNSVREFSAYYNRKRAIEAQVRKNKSTIYGSVAIKRQIGHLARTPGDYDILSRRPRQSARQLQANLDKQAGGDWYYDTPSKYHKGTYKVYHKGNDGRRGTKDDIGIADFSKMTPGTRTVKIGGLRYVHTSEIKKDKRKSLADPMFAFRHAKDRTDLNNMNLSDSFFKLRGNLSMFSKRKRRKRR